MQGNTYISPHNNATLLVNMSLSFLFFASIACSRTSETPQSPPSPTPQLISLSGVVFEKDSSLHIRLDDRAKNSVAAITTNTLPLQVIAQPPQSLSYFKGKAVQLTGELATDASAFMIDSWTNIQLSVGSPETTPYQALITVQPTSEPAEHWFAISSIRLQDHDGSLIQQVVPVSNEHSASTPPAALAQFQDLNFDGKKDLQILLSSSVTGNAKYEAWLYFRSENLNRSFYFARIPSFAKLTNPKPRPEERLIGAHSRDGATYYDETFRFIDDQFTIVERQITNLSPDAKQQTVLLNIDGKLQEVKHKLNLNYKDIRNLVRQAYAWRYRQKDFNAYHPVKTINNYHLGLDRKAQSTFIRKLTASGFFSTGFVGAYQEHLLQLDKKLRNGAIQWVEGSTPDFVPNADPWCNCQDYPDNFWQDMELDNIQLRSFDDRQSILSVTWSFPSAGPASRYDYTIILVNDHDGWKIDAMDWIPSNSPYLEQ